MTDTPESTDRTVNVDAAAVAGGGVGLFVADFDDLDAAWEAYDLLKNAADGKRLKIEGVIVFKKTDHGAVEVQKVTDRETKRGLKWGIVGGVALGVLFPPSILGSAVVLGAGGAGIGRLRHLHSSSELAEELGSAVAVGHSGLIALVTDPAQLEIEKALSKANAIVSRAVDKAVAMDIEAEADLQERESSDSKSD